MISAWTQIFTAAEKKLLLSIMEGLDAERKNGRDIAPIPERIFAALSFLPSETKVVICGQDPYPTRGVANGIAFAVNKGVPVPASLRNIFKEVEDDIGDIKTDETLMSWVEQGVLLLNNTLTVEVGKPNSHLKFPWYRITNRIIRTISGLPQPIVFILFGVFARSKKDIIGINPNHLIIETAHPSPLSANRGGFFGTRPFSKANDFLRANGITEIIW
jgi:uracil-DNA glycosylase